MKKILNTNLLIALFGICLFYFGNILVTNIRTTLGYEYNCLLAFLYSVLAMFFGFIISLPLRRSVSSDKFYIDWNKLIIQGIPALLLSVPYTSVIFIIMKLYNKNTFDLGIFNRLIDFQSSNNIIFYIISSVWFGKVVADSIKMKSKRVDDNKVSTSI